MSVSVLYEETLALRIGNPRAYAPHLLEYAIGECDVILADTKCGPATKAFAQEQRDSFIAELHRKASLPPTPARR